MESFVHADDPAKAMRIFWRVVRPASILVMHEADYHTYPQVICDALQLSHRGNTQKEGVYEAPLESCGFVDVSIENLHANVLRLWRLLGLLGAMPY